MAPYLMNHYLRKYLIKIWCIIDEIILLMLKLASNKLDTYLTSWALFVFCISWNFARDIWTVFEEIKHQSCTRKIFYQIIKINKTQILLKYFFGAGGVKFLEKRLENVQIFQARRWHFDIWEAIFAVKNDGMSACNSYIQM